MAVTEFMQKALDDVNERFVYRADGDVDDWDIIRGDDAIEGDCEDYALAVLWNLSGQSWLKFFWLLLSFQAVIWHVKSYQGNGHAVLWYKGYWCDNMMNNWYETKHMLHKRRFPQILPTVLLKLLIGKLIN